MARMFLLRCTFSPLQVPTFIHTDHWQFRWRSSRPVPALDSPHGLLRPSSYMNQHIGLSGHFLDQETGHQPWRRWNFTNPCGSAHTNSRGDSSYFVLTVIGYSPRRNYIE